ncbi:MAG TPA: hypothetical protein VEV83_11425 [Parafilimonas sp.]|nr:hypothetical protein [Parafilimonas sp.]
MATITVLPVAAQLSNLRSKKIPANMAGKIDSLSIVPNTFFIEGYDSSWYTLDWVNAMLTFKRPLPIDSVQIIYRVFPQKLNAVAQRYRYDSIKNNFVAASPVIAARADESFINFGKLNYNGSFGKSISIGNTQDAVFNSQLNLQLSGYIGDSIELNAAITDNNIPIQPDGTTAQLNEFDNVLLQFKKKTWELNLGDIDLRQDENYFLKFYKRLQGLSYEQRYKVSEHVAGNTLLSGAIAKGKFARNIFEGEEGNQGPYKLQGNNNELFFIVLAGTEKVFLNGVQVQRGEDQDYVINYNTAEILFTPKQMITKDTRIQVEFEYADRNYLNSMLYINNDFQFGKKVTVNVSAYSNADAKNSPIDQNLDNAQKQFLANLGDSIQDAFYPVANIDTFSINKILYKKIDTVYDGSHDSIYVYSTSLDSARYALNFVFVGVNKGNYVPLFNAVNGNVYQWIQPLNGVAQGSYEPASFLVTPKKQQVVNAGIAWQIDDKTLLRTEFAFSNYDVNTFSSKDKENDKGYASKIDITRTIGWKTKNKTMQLTANADYEWVDKNFQPVERLRPVEFTRDWGLPLLTQAATEHLPSFTLDLKDDKNNDVLYRFSSYIRSDDFTGIRNEILHHQILKGFELTDAFSLTNSTTPADKGFFLRPNVDLHKTFSAFHNYTLGTTYELEHNEQRNDFSDTLTPLSYAFGTFSAYVHSDATKSNHWSFTYFTRGDKLPSGESLVQTDRSHNYNFQGELYSNKHHQVRVNATYRQLYVYNTQLTSQTPDNSLLGRAEYFVNEWKGFVIGNTLYEIGSGQEQKRSFSYVEVPAGTGLYAWIDYNNDGIQQLNEFELAAFPDQAKFIRIYTPTNEYIKANYTQFNYAVTLNPKVFSKGEKDAPFMKFLTRFVLQSSLQTYKKQQSDGNPTYGPFKGSINDTTLINLNHTFSNTLSYNRYSSVWGIDLTNITSFNKSLLTYGFETLQQKNWNLKCRMNIGRSYTVQLEQRLLKNSLATPSFANRNYDIEGYVATPQLIFTSGTKYRIETYYQFQQKKNAPEFGGEKAVSNSFNVGAKYNAVSSTSLSAGFQFSNINFSGIPNTSVSYIMLEGLLPGQNLLWNLSLTKRLINNLEISIEYEGRKPAETRVINTGRASIRALL